MGTYRIPVTLTGTAPGGPYINVWHVQTGAGADDLAVLNAKAALIRTFYTDLNTSITNVGQIIGGGLVVSADFATEVSSGLQQPLTWSPLTTAATATQAPQRLALVVSWKSVIAARRATGRTFVGPLNGAVVDSTGFPKPQVTAALRGYAKKLIDADAAAGNGVVGVYGLTTSGGGPSDPHQLYTFTRAVVKEKFATLRRRA